ncbi:hypothetical protein TNCV_3408851 [Trichonephila clavipes]|nr:hypothetical protein TNCV_3408851 [Trichonephila clavipes]
MVADSHVDILDWHSLCCVTDILTGYVIDFEFMCKTKNLSIRNVQLELTHGVFTSPQNQKEKKQLASNELLERCIDCGTKNANESLHNMIWSKCPKEKFVSKDRVKHVVPESIKALNKRTLRTIREIQRALNIPLGKCSYDFGRTLQSRKR